MGGQHGPGSHLLIAALLCVKLEGTGTGLSSGLQQGHAGLLWKICTLIFCSSKAEVVGMKENSLWSSYLESMNSWAFYSSGMLGTRVWFYKASKPQLKVWMNINHSGTMTAARVLPFSQVGLHCGHCVLFSPLALVCREGSYYLQADLPDSEWLRNTAGCSDQPGLLGCIQTPDWGF